MGFGTTLHGGPVDSAELQRVREALLFEGNERTYKLVRFSALLLLSTAIATFGLIGDSVATVIGAMIVAPLMTPIMGLAFGVSVGSRRAISSSLLIVLAGATASIALGFLLAWPMRLTIDVASSAQIASRTHPGLIDLGAALATGLAGAFATSRRDVADTLPGVAIAISLVPPLANTGILLAVGEYPLAWGSLLLFITNLLAILLSGAIVFGVMGFGRAAFAERSARAGHVALALVVAFALVITIPLAVATTQAVEQRNVEQRVNTAADKWVAGSGYRVQTVNTDGTIIVRITGSGPVPDKAPLRAYLLGQTQGQPVKVEISPVESFTIETVTRGG